MHWYARRSAVAANKAGIKRMDHALKNLFKRIHNKEVQRGIQRHGHSASPHSGYTPRGGERTKKSMALDSNSVGTRSKVPKRFFSLWWGGGVM